MSFPIPVLCNTVRTLLLPELSDRGNVVCVLPNSLRAERMINLSVEQDPAFCGGTHRATKELVESNSTTKQIHSSLGQL
jgi:hypothetical protein